MRTKSVVRVFVEAFWKLLGWRDWRSKEAKAGRLERRQNGYDSTEAAMLGRRKSDDVGGEG